MGTWGQTGKQGGMTFSDCGATGVEFVAKKKNLYKKAQTVVVNRVCNKKAMVEWCRGGADAMMKGVGDPHTWLGFSYSGAALSPFPHPRILKIRLLLLHSV